MTDKNRNPFKYPVCLKPEEITALLGEFEELAASLPTGKAKTGLLQFHETFKERMDARGANNYENCVPDEVPISIGVLQEIWEISDCLESIVMVFERANDDEYEEGCSILRPIMRQLQRIVSEHFPEYVREMA